MKPAKRKPKALLLGTGELWFVRLPGASQLACVDIDEVTEKTVVFRAVPELGNSYGGLLGRYERAEVRFVERLP